MPTKQRALMAVRARFWNKTKPHLVVLLAVVDDRHQ